LTWGEERIADELSLKLGVYISPRNFPAKDPRILAAATGDSQRTRAKRVSTLEDLCPQSCSGHRWAGSSGFALEEVKTLLRHENIATTSQIYGAPQIEAKRELQRRSVEFVKQQAELEGWKPEKDLWVKCPTVSTSVQ
jgi:hypothetical protein